MKNFCREWAYPLPDDGLITLGRIREELAPASLLFLDFEMAPTFVLALRNLADAVLVRTGVDSERPLDVNGQSVLEEHEVWVPQEHRTEAQRLLDECCRGGGAWYQVLVVRSWTTQAFEEFRATYARITAFELPALPPCGNLPASRTSSAAGS